MWIGLRGRVSASLMKIQGTLLHRQNINQAFINTILQQPCLLALWKAVNAKQSSEGERKSQMQTWLFKQIVTFGP